jgi:hypothetical protein
MLERTSVRFAALALVAGGMVAAGAGCQNASKREAEMAAAIEANRALDAELVSDVDDLTQHNGIIAQRTLYPHHFEAGSATLNSLGERDLTVLAEHIRSQAAGSDGSGPWTLNVRRGNASDALYSARVKTVTDGMTGIGVAANSVRVVDGSAGGQGMPSESVRVALDRESKSKQYYEEKGTVPALIIDRQTSTAKE